MELTQGGGKNKGFYERNRREKSRKRLGLGGDKWGAPVGPRRSRGWRGWVFLPGPVFFYFFGEGV